jgi:hypothetical protein
MGISNCYGCEFREVKTGWICTYGEARKTRIKLWYTIVEKIKKTWEMECMGWLTSVLVC